MVLIELLYFLKALLLSFKILSNFPHNKLWYFIINGFYTRSPIIGIMEFFLKQFYELFSLKWFFDKNVRPPYETASLRLYNLIPLSVRSLSFALRMLMGFRWPVIFA